MARVLLVEDSPTQASEARFLLEDAGYQVDVAGDGIDALQSLARRLPNVIVTDLQMPRMDGLALVEAVRRQHPTVPVVLITAHGSEEIASAALVAGAASYVPKKHLARDLARVLGPIIDMAAPDSGEGKVIESLEEVRLHYRMANEDSLVSPLIRRLERLVHEMGICDRPDLIRVGVALQEAIINAMDHGNLELDSQLRQDDERVYYELGQRRRREPPYCDRRVRIEAEVTRSRAAFTVRDEGPGFDPSLQPDPTDAANLNRIGGRGLLLMRTLMDEVRFNTTGNEIVLIKNRSSRQSPGT